MDTPDLDISQKLKNRFTLAFVFLFILVVFNILFVLRLQRVETPDPMNEYLKQQIKLSEQRILRSEQKVDSLIQLDKISREKIIELESKKTEIHYVYINKTKEIDNLSVNGIITEFNRILPRK